MSQCLNTICIHRFFFMLGFNVNFLINGTVELLTCILYFINKLYQLNDIFKLFYFWVLLIMKRLKSKFFWGIAILNVLLDLAANTQFKSSWCSFRKENSVLHIRSKNLTFIDNFEKKIIFGDF